MQIERAKDLDPGRFKGIKSVGIIGGASTPDILIEEVKKRLRSINKK
jgi:4-hydroxy-3-methylbut-2-enyl diphosphate reductase IspH